MDGHVEILKSLVDSLTTQLTNILIRIESINPILNRLLDESDHGNQISTDTLDKIKELKNDFSSNQQLIQQIPQSLKTISNIDSIVTTISNDIATIQNDLTVIKKQLIPVNKFSRFTLKPIGIVLFLLAMAGSIMGIVESIKFFVNR